MPWSVNYIDQVVLLMCSQYGHSENGRVNLHKDIVVLPSDKACRDFELQLIAYAAERNLELRKPQIITPLSIPGSLFYLPYNVLTESGGLLLATMATNEANRDERETITCRLRQATRLLSLRHELSSACVALEDIETLMGEYELPDRILEELERFKNLNRAYLKRVADAGLVELDAFLLQMLQAPKEQDLVRATGRVHLLACTELKEILVRGIAYVDAPVSVYVYAPGEWRERFDDWGRLNPTSWKDESINIREDSVVVVEQSFEQINAVADMLAQVEGPVTIVACDRSLAESLKSDLVNKGYYVENSVSPENGNPGLVTLIDIILRLPISGARELGNLLFKHPDILRWFDEAGEPPYSRAALSREWDAFLCNHLPGPAYSLSEFFSDDRALRYEALAIASKLIAHILPYDVNTGGFDIGQVSKFLMTVYGAVSDDAPQKEFLNGAMAQWNELKDLAGASGELLLSVFSFSVKNSAKIQGRSAGEGGQIIADGTSSKVRIVGWLDSALDRSGSLLLTSVNEGILPEPQRFDYLLSDSVREKLGLVSGKSRDIRDKYVLMSILGSEKRVKFFASRTLGSGEGALLSRLILSQGARDNARLILEFFRSSSPIVRKETQGKIFRARYLPVKTDLISVVPVSGLTAYKACPYRFYLRYVLGIMPEADLPREIDGAGFGRIAHQVLKDLLLYERQTGSKAEDLKIHSSRLIDAVFEKEFREFSFPAVGMQMDRLRLRIERFLEQHSRMRDEGWETISLEERIQAHVVVPGRGASALPIRGQIDRIDIHRQRNEARIYDYKTGEGSQKTDSYHIKKGEMVNFQLPAYKHLLERNRNRIRIGEMKISVAIYNISAQAEDVSYEPAGWSDEDYRAIDNEMFDILGKIQAGEFNLVAEGEDVYSWLISQGVA